MFAGLFFALILLFSQCNAGDWKSSLDFELDGSRFGYISSFHRGLCDYEKDIVRKTSAYHPGVGTITADNVGNAVLPTASYAAGERSPTNTKNVALASLQIILKDGDNYDSRFIHIQNQYKSTIDRGSDARIFYSYGKPKTPDLRDIRVKAFYKIKDHFNEKTKVAKKTLVSCPSKIDRCFETYHQDVHSEDRIFYELGGKYHSKDGELVPGYIRYIDECLKTDGLTSPILAVVLHIHTRFDMCGTCAYALSWELNSSYGFGDGIFNYCNELNNSIPYTKPISFSSLVSSRQSHLVWGSDRRTLPDGPPSIPIYDQKRLFAEYSSPISLGDLSKRKKFAQSVIPSFLSSPPVERTNPFYDFASGRYVNTKLRVRFPKLVAITEVLAKLDPV